MKKWLFMLSFFAFVGIGFAISNHHASAFGLCDVLARPKNTSTGDCTSQYEDAFLGNGTSPINQTYNLTSADSSDTLKSKFISSMHVFESGYHFQKIGAAYIEKGLMGGDAETAGDNWITRVDDPSVRLAVITTATCSGQYKINSAYSPSDDAVISYSDSCPETLNRPILAFYQTVNGAESLKYMIKEDCGNPIGNLPGLNSNSNASAVIVADCRVSSDGSRRYYATATYSDQDGHKGNSARAYLVSTANGTKGDTNNAWRLGNNNGADHNKANSSSDPSVADPYNHTTVTNNYKSARFTWSSNTWPAGASIAVRVYDVGGLGYVQGDTVAKPDCGPTGSFASATCATQPDGNAKYALAASWSDIDAATPAAVNGYLTDKDGKRIQGTKLNSPATWSIAKGSYSGSPPYSVIDDSKWPIQLWVEDAGSSDDHYNKVNTVNRPNCDPSGIIAATCEQVTPTSNLYTVSTDPSKVPGASPPPVSYADANGTGTNKASAFLASDQYTLAQIKADPSLRLTPISSAASPYRTGDVTWTGSSWPGGSTHKVELWVYDAGGSNDYVQVSEVTAPDRLNPTCSPSTTGPHCDLTTIYQIEPVGDNAPTFTVSEFVGTTAPSTLPAFSFHVYKFRDPAHTGPMDPADPVAFSPASPNATYTSPDVVSVPIQLGTLTPGAYAIQWQWNGNTPCSAHFKAGYTPFFNVQGGDVTAGAHFTDPATGCTDADANTDTADIKGWNDDAPGSYTGAGVDFAAIAGGDVRHFGTVQTPQSNVGTLVPGALAFANAPSSTFVAPTYGGSFESIPCVDDYYDDSVTGATALSTVPASGVTGGGGVGSNTLTALSAFPNDKKEHIYSQNGDLVINLDAGEKLNARQRVTIRVNGNVYINSNIKYGPYTLDTIPRLSIYASGNILVSGAVTVMHGLYSAQKQTGMGAESISGAFITCYDSTLLASKFGLDLNAGNLPERTTYSLCNHVLTVYGAVAADSVHLDRTYGTLYGASRATPGSPAEVFQYTPELWLSGSTSCGGSVGDCYDGTVKTITGLPPVL